MSNRLLLDKSYDLYLSMTWPPNTDHGVSGHIYEIIDYYLLLKDHLKVGIAICENMTWKQFRSIIVSKYNVSDSELTEIEHSTVFHPRPKILRGNNVLFVDGGIKNCLHAHGVLLFFNHIFSFRCAKEDTHHDLIYKNLTLLQDNRVYSDEDNNIAIDYKKRIKFDSYNDVAQTRTNTALLYLTKNCRLLSDGDIIDVIRTYDYENYMILTSTPKEHKSRFANHDNLHFPAMPVDNIFEKFDTYIYTPTKGSADCSPRFIAECKHYGKEIIYHNIDESYLDRDPGLKYRRYDIENDFDSVNLKPDDDIIDILHERI